MMRFWVRTRTWATRGPWCPSEQSRRWLLRIRWGGCRRGFNLQMASPKWMTSWWWLSASGCRTRCVFWRTIRPMPIWRWSTSARRLVARRSLQSPNSQQRKYQWKTWAISCTQPKAFDCLMLGCVVTRLKGAPESFDLWSAILALRWLAAENSALFGGFFDLAAWVIAVLRLINIDKQINVVPYQIHIFPYHGMYSLIQQSNVCQPSPYHLHPGKLGAGNPKVLQL